MGFYLGRGVTWVMCSNGCGLPRLVCFSKVALHFSHFTYYLGTCCGQKGFTQVRLRFAGFVVPYLCFGGTWVHVVTEKDLLRLIYIYGACCLLPVFWWYLGTCYD